MMEDIRARKLMREQGEKRCRQSMLRLVVGASMLRTALTQVVPLAGSASWWVTCLLFLPGVLLCFVLGGLMRRQRGASLMQIGGSGISAFFARTLAGLYALALLADGVLTLSALSCFMMEGMDWQGTGMVLALLACAAMLPCLDREGLPRGIFLLRGVMLACACLALLSALREARPNGLFPLLGGGGGAVGQAMRASLGLAWPLPLLLTEGAEEGKLQSARELAACCVPAAIVLLMLSMLVPHEALVSRQTLGQLLCGPGAWLHAFAQLLCYALWMLTLFLLLCSEVSLAGRLMGTAIQWPFAYWPYVLTGVLALSQLPGAEKSYGAASVCQAALWCPALLQLMTGFWGQRRDA